MCANTCDRGWAAGPGVQGRLGSVGGRCCLPGSTTAMPVHEGALDTFRNAYHLHPLGDVLRKSDVDDVTFTAKRGREKSLSEDQ